MANKWLQHLARFRQQNTHLNAREMMTAARKTYQGGAAAAGSYVASVSGSSVNTNTRNVSNTDSQFAAVGGRSTRRRRSRRRGGCGSGYNTNSNPSSLEGGRRRTSRKSRRRRR